MERVIRREEENKTVSSLLEVAEIAGVREDIDVGRFLLRAPEVLTKRVKKVLPYLTPEKLGACGYVRRGKAEYVKNLGGVEITVKPGKKFAVVWPDGKIVVSTKKAPRVVVSVLPSFKVLELLDKEIQLLVS